MMDIVLMAADCMWGTRNRPSVSADSVSLHDRRTFIAKTAYRQTPVCHYGHSWANRSNRISSWDSESHWYEKSSFVRVQW